MRELAMSSAYRHSCVRSKLELRFPQSLLTRGENYGPGSSTIRAYQNKSLLPKSQ